MIEILIGSIVILSLLLLVSFVVIINIKKQNKKMAVELSNREAIANESYGKFIYESREWAFKYIEDVQSAIKSFADKVEPQLKYFNEYGRDVQSPHITMLSKISDAYDELSTLLPEENKEK